MKASGAPSPGDFIRIDFSFGESRYALVVEERGSQISIIYLKDYHTGWPREYAWWIPRTGHGDNITIVSSA
jgi:hypothetical protein